MYRGKPRPCPADGPANGVTHVNAENVITEVSATYTGDIEGVHFQSVSHSVLYSCCICLTFVMSMNI